MSQKQGLHERLAEQAAEERRVGRIDYSITAFMLKQPYTEKIVEGPVRVAGRDEHRRLLERARELKLYLWFASVVKTDDNKYVLSWPHIIDWDSVPEKAYGFEAPARPAASKRYPDDLKCPKCGKQCSSTSGFTLHMNSHLAHEDLSGEDLSGEDLSGEDLSGEDLSGEDETNSNLKCPKCGKQCSSTSGFTLHMKHKHGG